MLNKILYNNKKKIIIIANNNNNNNNINSAPFYIGALQDAALNKKLLEFKRLSSNIKLINAHDALLILTASSCTSHVFFHVALLALSWQCYS